MTDDRPSGTIRVSRKERHIAASPVRETQYRNSLAFASSTTQARPSFRLTPVMALHRKMCQRCVRISSSFNACREKRDSGQYNVRSMVDRNWTSKGQQYRATLRFSPAESRLRPCIPGHPSCLQRPANWPRRVSELTLATPFVTEQHQDVRTSSWSSPCSSSRQSSMRSRSVASTTQMRASVLSK